MKIHLNRDRIYESHRTEPIDKVKAYLNITAKLPRHLKTNEDVKLDKEKTKLMNDLLAYKYNDLLIIQSSEFIWEQLMHDRDTAFRRKLSTKLYNLNEIKLRKVLGIGKSTTHYTLNTTAEPKTSTTFKLATVLNLPFQFIIEEDPVASPNSVPAEFGLNVAAKRISIENIYQERKQVEYIAAYMVTNPGQLFDYETGPILARWVRSYPEMEYLEFQLDYEPALYREKTLNAIFETFPFATHLITTYTPLRPTRSLWIMGPKTGKEAEFQNILKELAYRDRTEINQMT